jgi:hypothetical protein
MRHRLAVLLLLALMVAPAVSARASDNRNAATWYRRAFERLEQLPEADRDLILSYLDNPGTPPSTRLREALARAAPAMDLVRRGSRQEYADSGLDYSQGFDMILPHLAPMRTLSKIMQADAMVRLHDGDSSAAADRITATYRLAEHCADDCILISSLVGAAVFNVADLAAQYGFDHASFTGPDCENMLRAVDRLATGDPFNMVESVAMEQELAITWLQKHLGTEADRQNVPEAFQWLVEDERAAAGLAQMTDADFQAQLDAYDRGMDRYVEAVSMEDREAARAELQRLSEEIAAGEHGFLASFLMPALNKYYDRMCDVKDRISRRAEMLRALATGQVRPEEEANAALYYARGIELLGKIEPERFRAICALERGEIAEPDEAMRATFEEGQGVVDLFREGSQKKRCDFAILRPRRELPFCFDYIGGLRDAIRFLHADALRLLRAGDGGKAADRLAIGYRVVAHLEGDEPILSALLAHRIFDRTNEIATGALKIDSFAAEQRATLLAAAEHIGRKDPFGYISSLLATRDALGPALYEITSPGEFDPERYSATKETVKGWDGDQLLSMLAVLDTMTRAGEDGALETDAGAKDRRFAPLADVISLSDLEAARRAAARIAPRLARGEIDIFTGRDITRFGRAAERMHSARGDLRRALAVLRLRPRPAEGKARNAPPSPAPTERP